MRNRFPRVGWGPWAVIAVIPLVLGVRTVGTFLSTGIAAEALFLYLHQNRLNLYPKRRQGPPPSKAWARRVPTWKSASVLGAAWSLAGWNAWFFDHPGAWLGLIFVFLLTGIALMHAVFGDFYDHNSGKFEHDEVATHERRNSPEAEGISPVN